MSKARQLADLGNVYDDGALSNRNMVTNGSMIVAQRGTSVTGVNSGGYRTCDRWLFDVGENDTGAWTISQASDGPEGFVKSMKFECTTAKSDISADWRYVNLQHRFEGQDVAKLKFGTSNAEGLTVSFWVKSNKTGTYTVELANENASYRLSTAFSVSSSGAWEKKTITVSGDTAHGFVTDNTRALVLLFWLAASPNLSSGSLNTTWSNSTAGRASGSNVNLADTVGNYFQITGVQLEVGDTATPFEHRSYGDELARCQRYYEQELSYDGNSLFWSGNTTTGFYYFTSCGFAVTKRTAPTVSIIGENRSGFNEGISVTVHPTLGVHGFRTTAVASGNNSGAYFRCQWTADAEL
jgi:hypothetical protein